MRTGLAASTCRANSCLAKRMCRASSMTWIRETMRIKGCRLSSAMISRWNESRISSAMRIAAYMCGPVAVALRNRPRAWSKRPGRRRSCTGS